MAQVPSSPPPPTPTPTPTPSSPPRLPSFSQVNDHDDSTVLFLPDPPSDDENLGEDERGVEEDEDEEDYDAYLEDDWEPYRHQDEQSELNDEDGHNNGGDTDSEDDIPMPGPEIQPGDNNNDDDNNNDSEPNLEEDPSELDGHSIHYTVVSYHDTEAGAPVSAPPGAPPHRASADNPHHPFTDGFDWGVAQWAKLRGPGSTAFTELLEIDGMKERLNLSFDNMRELDQIIDKNLTTRRPQFHRREIVMGNRSYDVYYRDITECIRALWADEDLSKHLIFAPERHHNAQNRRVYHDMHTARWWWATQQAIDAKEKGGTVVPVLISSDKTTLTTFGGKSAYPVYMTIGNIPKSLRRKPSRHAQVLVGYLPTTSLKHVASKTKRRRMVANLFHACMHQILAPLEKAGEDGIKLQSADGFWRRCHPIFATFVGDYPEQILVTCVKKGRCALCCAPREGIGDKIHRSPPRDLDAALVALGTLSKGPTAYTQACEAAGIKPIQKPFWEQLPYCNIFNSITPDILHQVYQGVIKHLVSWLRLLIGDKEIDARCRRLPPNHQLRHFAKGITHMQRVTGKEHADICRILLSLVTDTRLTGGLPSPRVVQAVRALLDFVYLAQFPVHTEDTLTELDNALQCFHDNKSVFYDLQARTDFNIPKFHALEHYTHMITIYGTTDNYNTEYTERLHIDLAKNAYRSTNKKEEFPQMTRWLERREKIFEHQKCIQVRLDQGARIRSGSAHQSTGTITLIPTSKLKMTKHPTVKRVDISTILSHRYGASQFQEALASFITAKLNPTFSWRRITTLSRQVVIQDYTFSIFHSIKFVHHDSLSPHQNPSTLDIIHVKPTRANPRPGAQPIPGRFDTVLLSSSPNIKSLRECRIAQVRVVFTLPAALIQEYLSNDEDFDPTTSESPSPDDPQNTIVHLAYVELFTKLPHTPDANGLYQIKPEKDVHGKRTARIVPVACIRRSIHLYPKFGSVAPANWTSNNVLDTCPTFYVNPFSDRELFLDFHSQ